MDVHNDKGSLVTDISSTLHSIDSGNVEEAIDIHLPLSNTHSGSLSSSATILNSQSANALDNVSNICSNRESFDSVAPIEKDKNNNISHAGGEAEEDKAVDSGSQQIDLVYD